MNILGRWRVTWIYFRCSQWNYIHNIVSLNLIRFSFILLQDPFIDQFLFSFLFFSLSGKTWIWTFDFEAGNLNREICTLKVEFVHLKLILRIYIWICIFISDFEYPNLNAKIYIRNCIYMYEFEFKYRSLSRRIRIWICTSKFECEFKSSYTNRKTQNQTFRYKFNNLKLNLNLNWELKFEREPAAQKTAKLAEEKYRPLSSINLLQHGQSVVFRQQQKRGKKNRN